MRLLNTHPDLVSPNRAKVRFVLDCGGKRSATPLWRPAQRNLPSSLNRSAGNKSSVAAALCHRSPKSVGADARSFLISFISCN
jgi:hypothetical protein